MSIETIVIGEVELRRYAAVFHQATLESLTRDWRKVVNRLPSRRARQKLRSIAPADVIPDIQEVMSIGREPFCEHGLHPRLRCKECMVLGTFAASVQRIYRLVYGFELSDEKADEWAVWQRDRRSR